MRICALLAWYDEDPGFLRDCILSLPRAGVTHLVAVDGAYAAFPDAKKRSSQAEHEAIREASDEAKLTLSLTTPAAVWSHEMAKRTFMFRKAERITERSDFYFVVDGDYRILESPDLRTYLPKVSEDVAGVKFVEPKPGEKTRRYDARIIFRAVRGLRVVGDHFTYVTPDNRCFLGTGLNEPAHIIEGLTIEHRTFLRDKDRHKAAWDYYGTRDQTLLEGQPCVLCGGPPAKQLPTNLRPAKTGFYEAGGQAALEGGWAWYCKRCIPGQEARNHEVWAHYGVNPDHVSYAGVQERV